MRIGRMLLLLAAAAAGLSQSEDAPYFALSSNRTWGTNGKPSVALSAWNVDSLEFRVYRVSDPLTFFREMEDAHQFGGSVPPPPRERTLLEKIVRWKRSLRADIRRSMRAQFTESPRAHIGTVFARTSPPASKEIRFAEAPVLNPQQLTLSFVHKVQSKTRWDRQAVDINVTEKGVYLVEAVNKDLRAYTIVMVSDIVLITKGSPGHVVNFVVDRETGEPLRDVPVAAIVKGRPPLEARTDANGVAELRLRAARDADLRIVAHHGRDYAVNTVYGGAVATQEQWMGYIYTDRPVYRPGHTVNFKGILRLRTATGFQVPAGRTVSVTINDPEQKPLYQKTLTASATGAIRDSITLPAGAALGHHFLEVKAGEDFMSGHFEVEEYKKPEYEVRVTPSKGRVLQGESVPVTVDARYYFGEPVSGAKVTYAIYRERYWFPLWYDPDDERSGEEGPSDDEDGGDQIGEQEGQLDADGKLSVNIPTTVSEHKFDYRYRIEARVTDAANREITGRGSVIATYAGIALNVEPEHYVVSPGSRAAFRVAARTYDNTPVRTRVKVELLRWRGRRAELQVLQTAEVETGADGSASAAFDIPTQGGPYRVRATARTQEGREPEATGYFYVSGGGWDYGATDRSVQIIPDKKTYRAGETAHLLIVAGKSKTPVYVSVEGRELRQHKLLRSAGETLTFDVPIASSDEPGITVEAGYVRDGTFYNGSKYVRVPPVDHQLDVKLSTDKAQYQPGETAEYRIEATGMDGKPAPRAEFSLSVVDEAIYAIRRDTTPDILRFFFEREWNRISTETSLNYYFHGEAGKRRMRLAELRPPSRLAQLKPDRLVEPKIRKAFPDTAFWATDLVTDAAGRARARVEFPDSLTTWRATARGITPDTRVGSGTLKTIVRKNLILRLTTPRFFVQGDEMTISSLVHNYLAEAKKVRVSLDAAGLEIVDSAPREVTVPSRGDAKVDWRVRVKQVRQATVTGKALTNEESDAVQLDLPVLIPGVKQSEARGGSFAAGGSAAFDLTFPASAKPGSRLLAINVSPSIAGSLFGALEYLTAYPYGCVEQTMSSFLPNIVVRQVINELGIKVTLDERALAEKIRAGLYRLHGFQHEDGGWGWWETDDSHHFMTAYVVTGLVQAKAAGAPVKAEAIDRGVQWLRGAFSRDPKLAGDLRAYMVYAMTLAAPPDPAALGSVFERRTNLSPYGMALLGLAFEQAKDPRASEIAAALESAAQQDQEQAWWPATRDALLDFADDVTPEATAWVAKFLSHQRPQSPLLPKAALWLMNHRNEGFWWSSTKQTAMVIYGLTDYLKATKELNPNLNVTVFVNDKPVLTRRIDQAMGLNPPDLMLDESKLNPGANRIRLTATGEGRVYYSTRAEHYSSDERLQKTGTASLNLLREYFRLVPSKDGERIVYDTVPLSGPVAVGDMIAVRLTASGSEWKYLMIEDPIPAGAEFIERDNAYEIRNRPPWWAYNFTRRELHDDRMAIFETYFNRQEQYFYLLKVVNPGVFQVSPARIQPMYQPGVMATTEARRLEVQ